MTNAPLAIHIKPETLHIITNSGYRPRTPDEIGDVFVVTEPGTPAETAEVMSKGAVEQMYGIRLSHYLNWQFLN